MDGVSPITQAGGHQGPEGDEGRWPRRMPGDRSTEMTTATEPRHGFASATGEHARVTLADRCGTPANNDARATDVIDPEVHRVVGSWTKSGGLGHLGLSGVEAEISTKFPSRSDVDGGGVIDDLGGGLPSQRPRSSVKDGRDLENRGRFGLGSGSGVFEELEACMRVLERLCPTVSGL